MSQQFLILNYAPPCASVAVPCYYLSLSCYCHMTSMLLSAPCLIDSLQNIKPCPYCFLHLHLFTKPGLSLLILYKL